MEIRIENVAYAYGAPGSRIEALGGVSFIAPSGECTAIIGPSGCGKTTLLELVAGLRSSAAGQVLVGGQQVLGPSASATVVFQDYALFPWYTVLKNCEYPLRIRGVPRSVRHRLCREQLLLFGLWDFRDLYPAQLSGGMKQRVALARALAGDPPVLLLDEPFSALDAYNRKLAYDRFLSLRASWNRTILLITHDLDEALLFADQIVVLTGRPGRVKKIFRLPSKPGERDLYEWQYRQLRSGIELSLFPSTLDEPAAYPPA